MTFCAVSLFIEILGSAARGKASPRAGFLLYHIFALARNMPRATIVFLFLTAACRAGLVAPLADKAPVIDGHILVPEGPGLGVAPSEVSTTDLAEGGAG